MGKRIDYSKVKKEYMTTKRTLTELADKYGISKTQLYKKAKEDGWEEKRNGIWEKRTDSVIEKAIDVQDDAWLKMKTKMLRMMEGVIDKYMENPEQSPERASSIIRAMKDMREMGAFGTTANEKKTLAEIEKLRKEISDDGNKDITVRVISDDVESYGE